MHFTLKELCEITNQPTATVANICNGVSIDTDGRFTILSYYYVYVISGFMEWCKIDALRKAIPFETIAPMVEMAKQQEETIQAIPPVFGDQMHPAPAVPAAGMVYPNWTTIVLGGGGAHTKVRIDICWRLLVRNARETLLEWLLAQRMKEGKEG